VEIQLLSRHGLSLRRIAAEVGCAVNTVRRHLALEAVPKYERKVKRPTKLAAHESYLRERQTAAQPNWIPASVLHREIVERGYQGGLSQLRTFMRSLRPALPVEPEVRFETAMGEQLQVDWVEFRKGSAPLHAFCATMGYSRASYVEFVSDMKVATLIGCHEPWATKDSLSASHIWAIRSYCRFMPPPLAGLGPVWLSQLDEETAVLGEVQEAGVVAVLPSPYTSRSITTVFMLSYRHLEAVYRYLRSRHVKLDILNCN